MAFRAWDTPYRPFRLAHQMSGAFLLVGAGVVSYYGVSFLFCTNSPTNNAEWYKETMKYAVAIKADPIRHPEVRGNLADLPEYDYWEKKKAELEK